jgi:hypothetical protein
MKKANDFTRLHRIEKVYNNYAEMVASLDINIVYIATPDNLHKERCVLALNVGKHLLCEKELAQSVTDAEEMYATAKKHKLMLQAAVWTRFFPPVEYTQMLLGRGAIGDVVMVQSDLNPLYTTQAVTLSFGTKKKPQTLSAMSAAAAMGTTTGGALFDFGDGAVHRCVVAGLSQCPQFDMDKSLNTLLLLKQIHAARETGQ